jgi:UDP-N-acetylmuramoyl-L-alanyl-D-glutamate--2,6-diaminopimelate ligase
LQLRDLIALINPLHVSNSKLEIELKSVHQDSRKVTQNSVFVAIRGTEVDGHLFLDDAIRGGASVIICEESFYTDIADVCIIEVENTRKILGLIAQSFATNPAEHLQIIGITGTNGKTTVATLVYDALTKLGKKASLLGTVSKKILNVEMNSSLTTSDPIELANDMKVMIDAGSEFLIMEVSSHALSQDRVIGFDFKIAAFTNLSHDHLDYHKTFDEYAQAKKLLFDSLPSTSTAVVNIDDIHGHYMIQDTQAKVREFSFKTNNNHILQNTSQGLSLLVDGVNIQSPLIGHFNAYNIAQAFLIITSLGIPAEDASTALKYSTGAAGRMETVCVNNEDTPKVIIDYAHTPDALLNVLATLHTLNHNNGSLHCVFGAGGDRDPSKRSEMAKVVSKYADYIVVTSDNPRFEDPNHIIDDISKGFAETNSVTFEVNRKIAIEHAILKASSKDIVLIAGKGHEDYQDIRGTKHPFNDYEIAKAALELKKEIH